VIRGALITMARPAPGRAAISSMTVPHKNSFSHWLLHELKLVGGISLYFCIWLGAFILLKALILAEYHLPVGKLSVILVGALILAKVVVLLEPVPLGRWVQRQPVVMDLTLRTLLYGAGAFLVLLLEKAFDSRHEAGGFGAALAGVFQHRDMPHVWANTLVLTGALACFNLLSCLREHLRPGGLLRLLSSPRAGHDAGAATHSTASASKSTPS